ncbi:MAG: SLBB domain-containing protein, partial [Bacteroidota bacterium]
MKILKYLLVISAMLLVHSAFAQIPPGAEAQAKARLEKVGGTEDEVRKRLIKRGIDPDKIDDRNPQELAELQIALEQIEKELAAEQKANAEAVKEEVVEEAEKEVEEKVEEKVKEVASQTTNEIVESVEEGATIEEAIAEEILEATEDEEAPAKIYGQNVFKDKEIVVYRDADDILAPDSYVLNTGDKIAVSLWGISELDAVYEINKEGFIKPDGIPRINLKGLRLGKAKALLFTRFSNYYRFGRDQFAITVTYPRTITVNIVGEVENQGSFTLPAINTAFNALAAADGPSSIGSVRNIKIISKDGKDKDMDIYKFLLNPVTAEDYYLNDGDYIYVGVAEKNIKISGAIRRPFIYELKENENLKDLIAYAGGLTPNAYRGNFQVKRIINDEVKIIDVDYRALLNSDGDFELVGGDEIIIGNIPTPYKNFVEIAGSVEYPGKYELENGMTISDLLQKGIMADGSRTDVAYLLRTDVDGKTEYQRISIEQLDQSADNLPLQPKDRLIVLSNKSYLDSYEISIRGAVRNPDKFRYGQEDELKLEDLVILSGGLKEDAAEIAYVHRKEFVGTDEQEYIQINIRNAVENPDSEDNIVLQPNDMVEVFSIFDYKEAYKVTISGAVRSPKSYPFAPGNEELRIEDLVLMSGGLKEDATSFAYVYRKDLQESKENTYIRINIKNAVENPDSGDNIILNANDVVQVFSIFDYKEEYSVSIAGAVRNPSTRPFDPSRNLKIEDLVILSGGLKVDAADF